jgi:signal transduction histidine kinase
VETGNIPLEVAPLVNALNSLLQQLKAAIEKEKRITADAAHELQTPLAAIKTEAQIALNHFQGIDKAPLIEIIDRVNRASRAVRQLTALSRLESAAGAFTQRVNLHETIELVRDSYSEQLGARKLTVLINDCHPVIYGNADMVRILVDNLVRNTLNHALEESLVSVTLEMGETSSLLIENQCRPITDHEWRLVTQRFYRVPGSQGDGSGLGMSIIQRICELHGATFTVGRRSSGDGFSVRIEFPRVP